MPVRLGRRGAAPLLGQLLPSQLGLGKLPFLPLSIPTALTIFFYCRYFLRIKHFPSAFAIPPAAR